MSFEYLEIRDATHPIRVSSTDAEMLNEIATTARTKNLGEMVTLEIDGMKFAIVISGIESEDDIAAFVWWLAAYLCHRGWEPLGRMDGRRAFRFELRLF